MNVTTADPGPNWADAPWTREELEAVEDELGTHYDEWGLTGIGGGYDNPERIPRGSAWVEKGSQPHPGLVAWRDSLEHPDMIEIKSWPEPGIPIRYRSR